MEAEDAGREGTLIVLNDVCGYSTVFQRGTSPSFILKEASSAPRVIDLAGKAIKSLTRFHTSSCQRGFAYIDADVGGTLLLFLFQANISRTFFASLSYRHRQITGTLAGLPGDNL
jgi:hypothetical protein